MIRLPVSAKGRDYKDHPKDSTSDMLVCTRARDKEIQVRFVGVNDERPVAKHSHDSFVSGVHQVDNYDSISMFIIQPRVTVVITNLTTEKWKSFLAGVTVVL